MRWCGVIKGGACKQQAKLRAESLARMFAWLWILGIVFGRPCMAVLKAQEYSCEIFERGAHFDPYEAIDDMWKIFYFWANTTETYPIMFSLPAKKSLEKFRIVVESWDSDLAKDIEWRRATLFMDPRPGIQVLLLYGGVPGSFRALVKKEQRDTVRPHPLPLISFADVRLKIVDQYMAMMACEEGTVYALSRLYQVPETETDCETAIATLGLNHLPKGRSYIWLANHTRRQINDEL